MQSPLACSLVVILAVAAFALVFFAGWWCGRG